ncbi:MAG: rod shape-determining protein RodA [Deltaproteobacteria bacterium]|nr:rod shape-determining protein RodA [Deltaproteobacteria bacterium]
MFDRRLLQNFDWALLGATLAICLLGVVAIHSASKGYPGESNYWIKQVSWIGLGLGLMFVLLLVDFRTIGRFSYVLHLAATASLVFLLLHSSPDLGGKVNRWFKVGSLTIQPSEFVKFTTIMAIAFYFRDSRRVGNLGIKGVVFPLLLVLVPFVLIVKQPDLGTAMMLLMIFFPMIIMAGLRTRIILFLAVAGVVGVITLILAFETGYYRLDTEVARRLSRERAPVELVDRVKILKGNWYFLRNSMFTDVFGDPDLAVDNPAAEIMEEEAFTPYISSALRPYQQRRILTFLNPSKDPLGAGYHVIQSKIAIGSGNFWGKGFGESTQGALNFLPARHTDFLFSIYAEEWGFVGSFLLIGLFLFVIQRCLSIILQTRDRFSAFLTMGITAIFASQVLINLGMVVGLLPVVGVPLPFFSYGGSSMITMMASLALILNIRMRRFLWA